LLGIEHRGTHATGFVATTFDNKVVLDKAPVKATDFIQSRERIPSGAQAILLHTRFKTQGSVENSVNNHPVIYKTCFTIHNGSIRNDDDLFEEHKLTRNGEVDTEIIAAMLDKYGMDSAENVSKALSSLRGHMAIAAIDPVRNPNQLLLARGESSPLHIYHTENYIVWASEGKVIREAWAKVFGTPPEWGKIGYLQEGKFWIANGKDVKETTYEVPKWAPLWRGGQHSPPRRSLYDRPTTRTQTRRNGSRTGSDGRIKPWEGKDSLFITEKEFLDTVGAYRASFEGVDNVHIWAHRDEYSDSDFKDIKLVVWVPCLCGHQVLSEDTKKHVKYGDICLDCYQVIIDKYRGEAEEKEEETSEEPPTVKVHTLTPEDRQSLDDWASVDARMNVLCIDEVCSLIGFDYTTVEYLIWRMEERATDTQYSKALRALQADVKKIYKAVEVEMWERHGNEVLGIDEDGNKDNLHVAFTVKKEHGVSELWFRCTQHGEEYRSGDECSVCVPEVGRSIPRYACMDCGEYFPRYQVKWISSGSSNSSNYLCEECEAYTEGLMGSAGISELALPSADIALEKIIRCPECNAFKRRDESCRLCVLKLDQEKTKALPERATSSCYCNTVKGKPCKRTVKYLLANKGYCYNHFVYCNRRKCDAKANHILMDGTRVCHQHARSEKGAKSDRQLGQAGIAIMEVNNG